jgi:hypothetical protein
MAEDGWQRVLLKLSGEAFAGDGGLGVDPDVVIRSRWLSAVGTISEVPNSPTVEWTGHELTTWACSALS